MNWSREKARARTSEREQRNGRSGRGGKAEEERAVLSRAACAPERTCERMCEKGGWEARILAGETLACAPDAPAMPATA